MKHIAVIGAGPIGLETAFEARRRGHPVTVYEAGRVGEHFLRYGPVRLFTPFRMNASPAGVARLVETGIALPGDEDIVTAEELRERYLAPLARLPELRGAVREGERVVGIARSGLRKTRAIAAAGDTSRQGRPFLLRIEISSGETRFDRADAVVDASGLYATPLATGPGGLAAAGEDLLGPRLKQHLPAILGSDEDRYAGARILLVGDGRSVDHALVDLAAQIARGGHWARTRVDWVRRERGDELLAPVPTASLRDLPELRGLHERACAVARDASWIRHHPDATVTAYSPSPSGAVQVALEDRDGKTVSVEVDQVLALVGYRPDVSLYRELQIHLCYASEAPMALASALLAAELANPESAGDCLAQATHGAETLKSPEPDFYILGAKSYGRKSHFLLSLGHAQVADVMGLLGDSVPTGVISR